MRYALMFFLALAFFSACKEKSKLETEVMAIHDEVMPKMGDMYVARKKLREIMKESNDESAKSAILKMIDDLEKADEGMMTWMADWKVPSDEPEKTNYLLKEKDKITKVKVDMLTSLENANKYIEKMSSK